VTLTHGGGKYGGRQRLTAVDDRAFRTVALRLWNILPSAVIYSSEFHETLKDACI